MSGERRLQRLRETLSVRGTTRWTHVASAVVLLSGALLHVAAGYSAGIDTSEHALGVDDAYISFRYARNLVEGHGLVFNPGERVEGFTNFGFVLACAFLLLFVDGEGLYWAVFVLNLILLLVLFVLFLRQVEQRMGSPQARSAAWLLALCPALWLWTASGMEAVAVTALQVALWISMERLDAGGGGRDAARLAVLLGLGAILRADGFLWIAVAAAYLTLRGRYRQGLRVGLLSAPVVLLTFVGRWVYYGEIWPNTYYAKLTESLAVRWPRGAAQLYDLATSHGLAPYLLVLLFALWRPIPPVAEGEREKGALLAACSFPSFFALCLAGYFVHTGGDALEERFLLVLFPFGIAAFLRFFSHLESRSLALLVTLLAILQTRPLFEDPRFAYNTDRYDCWVTLGRFLAEQPGDSVLAVDGAGKIPYFSRLRTIDMLGLTEYHIARVESRGDWVGHTKMAPEYVLDRRPDLIAAWIVPRLDVDPGSGLRGVLHRRTGYRLNLDFGLGQGLYERAGYRLAWMVNASKKSQPWNVLDVSRATSSEILDLVALGYRYGVLARSPRDQDGRLEEGPSEN